MLVSSCVFFSGASECEFDKQGRITLPQNLRTYGEIDKDVVVIGVSNRIGFGARALGEVCAGSGRFL